MTPRGLAPHPSGFGREGLAELARRPLLQLLLGATVAAQIISSHATSVGSAGRVHADARVPTFELPAAVVQPDTAVRTAWLQKAVERESARLTQLYRDRGFDVSSGLGRQIGEVAREFEIEPETAFGLVRAESSFRNSATSRVGAVGLTQLMPPTAAWIEPGVTRAQLRDPETNLRVGFKYLRYLIDKYDGNERLALLAYNRGPGTVDRALKRGRNPDNGYADFVYGKANHGHRLFTR